MPSLKNLTGQKFGKLTVLEKAPSRNKKVYWLCECDCGNKLEIQAYSLTANRTKSCGYCGEHPSKLLDITGQKFGTLTVLKLSSERSNSRQAIWYCQCDCGKIIKVRGTSLRHGEVSSCGDASCRGIEKDMTGLTFGKLTVISKSDFKNSYSNHTYWNCKCDCGNSCVVMGQNLRNGTTKSCGCLVSSGEMKINQLLNENNIIFEQQKIFENCYLHNGGKCRFDFYVEDSYLIEFDGQQHFYPIDHFGGEQQFQIQQERDNYKNQWCKENNIPLIRIPYTKLNTLCIEDLMLETTTFRIA
jgi:hypothetical protein